MPCRSTPIPAGWPGHHQSPARTPPKPVLHARPHLASRRAMPATWSSLCVTTAPAFPAAALPKVFDVLGHGGSDGHRSHGGAVFGLAVVDDRRAPWWPRGRFERGPGGAVNSSSVSAAAERRRTQIGDRQPARGTARLHRRRPRRRRRCARGDAAVAGHASEAVYDPATALARRRQRLRRRHPRHQPANHERLRGSPGGCASWKAPPKALVALTGLDSETRPGAQPRRRLRRPPGEARRQCGLQESYGKVEGRPFRALPP